MYSWQEGRECRVIQGSYWMPLMVTVSVYTSNTNLFKFLEEFRAQDRIQFAPKLIGGDLILV